MTFGSPSHSAEKLGELAPLGELYDRLIDIEAYAEIVPDRNDRIVLQTYANGSFEKTQKKDSGQILQVGIALKMPCGVDLEQLDYF